MPSLVLAEGRLARKDNAVSVEKTIVSAHVSRVTPVSQRHVGNREMLREIGPGLSDNVK